MGVRGGVLPWLLLALLLGGLLSACQDDTSEPPLLDVQLPGLLSLQISPDGGTLPLLGSLHLSVLGLNSDGSLLDLTGAVTWSLGGDPVASLLQDGTLSVFASGNLALTATEPNSGLQATALYVVPAAVVVGLQIRADSASVALGLPLELNVLGLLSDGSTVDLTSQVDWSVDDGLLASVGGNGTLLGLGLGAVTVLAVDPQTGLEAQVQIEVTPAVLQSIEVQAAATQLPLGLSQPLAAQGHLSDGSVVDLTRSVQWASSNGQVAGVGSGGLLTALGTGSAVVSATEPDSGSKGVLPVTVLPAALEWLEVTPADASVLLGLVKPFTATGHYSDGSSADLTRSVNWRSDNPLLATVATTGSALGLALGNTTIRAQEPLSGKSGAAALTVLGGLLGN
jgi:Bacterial Ig-like domain (group 2)